MSTPRKIGLHTARFLTHNERACTGRRCAECTPSTKTPTHRKDADA